jgi:hypothetical protein
MSANNVYEKSKDALAHIYASCGIDMLLGPGLKRNIADYYHSSAEPMGAAKLLIIQHVHARGCAKILRESITASDADKGIAIKKAVEALAGFEKDLCQIVIGEFAEVLGWGISAPPPQSDGVADDSTGNPKGVPIGTRRKNRHAVAIVAMIACVCVVVFFFLFPNHLGIDAVPPDTGKLVGADAEDSTDTSDEDIAPPPVSEPDAGSIVNTGGADVDDSADADIVAEILRGENRNLLFGGYTWRALDVQEDKALLITEVVIENRAYNTVLVGTWESCTLREYLNGEFYNSFGSEKSRIAQTENTNPDNQWYGATGGDSTKDSVFLLSIDEVVKYFGDSGQLENPENEYGIADQYSSERVAKFGNEAWWWWLRSPGGDSHRAAFVLANGALLVDGITVLYEEGGVRPALWLNLKSEIF